VFTELVQVSVKVVEHRSGAVITLPVVTLLLTVIGMGLIFVFPVFPVIAQDVALDSLQVKVDTPLYPTLDGLAFNVTFVTGCNTVTLAVVVADAVTVPVASELAQESV
jgi:hypothetical protein